MRVLDLDLDFFVHGIAHGRSRDHDRLSASEFTAWSVEQSLEFLEGRCGLTGPLPGVALTYHAELFGWWRDMIQKGHLISPFNVVHVDAHADLGAGDNGHAYIMTELLYQEPAERADSDEVAQHLTDGNFLAFAAACRWMNDLTYVRNEPFGPPVEEIPSDRFGQNDLARHFMKNNDLDADALQLHAVDPADFKRKYSRAKPTCLEPEIPFRYLPWEDYHATAPFDVVCLTRSPNYTPESADHLYDEIKTRFIDETAWS